MKADTESLKLRPAVFLRSTLGWAGGGLAGILGMVSTRFLDLSPMASAQITIGLVGLVGGFFHAFVIVAAGGEFRWRQGLILSAIWALSCTAGATPPFLTSGSPLKMAFLTFYSFAAAAAFGGAATAYVMRSLSGRASFDSAASIISWSLGFGFAAAAMDSIGGGLTTCLPSWFAWPAAFTFMSLVLGFAGYCSVLPLFRPLRGGEGTPPLPAEDDRSVESEKLPAWFPVLLLSPFYLNDFANIYVTDWRLWFFIDYSAVKFLPLLVIFWCICSKKIPAVELGLKSQPLLPFLAVFFAASVVGVFLDQNGARLLQGLPGYPALGSLPPIGDPLLKWIDMTAGLLLVGLCEELVFRGYLCLYISRFTKNPSTIVGISALAFGLIHWSGGAHQVVVSGVIGAVFMMLYLKTRSLPPIMLAHFAVNFIDYADVIPKDLFLYF